MVGQGGGIGEAVALNLIIEPLEAFKDKETSHRQSPSKESFPPHRQGWLEMIPEMIQAKGIQSKRILNPIKHLNYFVNIFILSEFAEYADRGQVLIKLPVIGIWNSILCVSPQIGREADVDPDMGVEVMTKTC
jgi:hypothetical protein